MSKKRGTFEEALDELIADHREEGVWLAEIISALELALMSLKQEED